jgi:pimeloyl-ACP methyl ester carboxylesterase
LLSALVLAAVIYAAGCSSSTGSSTQSTAQGSTEGATAAATSERADVGDTEVLVWGEGDYGVVMSHGAAYDAASWEDQAQEIARRGIVALAPEKVSPENLLASVRYLREERGVQGVAFMGASAGGSAVLRAAEENPDAADQLILLSATGDVTGLGDDPKLFVASEGEGIAEEARRMAGEAPGEQNEVLIIPGDAHAQAIFRTEEGDELMRALLEQLEERG